MDTRDAGNFARIACLTIQEGTERIRTRIINNIEGSQSFQDTLQTKQASFKSLQTKRILSKAQYGILFPNTGRVHLSNIDMTLWVILARNITVGRRRIRWGEHPKDGSTEWQHDVIRLKEIRNKLFHLKTPELSNAEYQDFKDDLLSVLRRLGSAEEVIQEYFTRDLDPEQTRICSMKVREQCLQEIHQSWLASIQGKKHARFMAVLLTAVGVLVIISIVTPVALHFTRTAPCASAIEKIKIGEGTTLNYMPRAGWGALPRRELEERPIPLLGKPVKKAVLFNTNIAENCDVTTDCCATIRYIQEEQYKSERVKWQDLAYNFLIGNDGVVYEGRGAYYVGGAAWRRNSEIVSIGFLGNFICAPPSRTAILALYVFLDFLQYGDPTTGADKSQPILTNDYKIYGHCQVNLRTPEHDIIFPDSPGPAFLREIRLWERLSQENMTACRLEADCMEPPDTCVPCRCENNGTDEAPRG